MALIIKSNVVANDPENKMPIYTEAGLLQTEVVTFRDNLGLQGYTLKSDTEKALSDFIKTLKDNSLWGRVLEVYPLVGKDVATGGLKLKSAATQKNMTPMTLSESFFTYVDGDITGKALTTLARNGYNTHLKASSLTNGFGLHVYTGEVVPTEGIYPSNAQLWGATSTNETSKGSYVSVVAGDSTEVGIRFAHNGSYSTAKVETMGGGLLQALCDSSGNKKAVFNGVIAFEGSNVVDEGLGNDVDLYLFCRNLADNPGIGHYYPPVKFAMLTDGNISVSENEVIRVAINKLMSDMGRTIV